MNKFNLKKSLSYLVPALVLIAGASMLTTSPTVVASDNNFTDGITVDSMGDGTAGAADGDCNDGAGNCTLREAIIEANAAAGAQTIDFNIAPFDGSEKVIFPATPLPDIVSEVSIDGYSQDDAAPNTAVAPEPMNGILRIRLDGSSLAADARGLGFLSGSDNSEIKGLSITNMPGFGFDIFGSSNIKVSGNYIGILTDGMTAAGNGYNALTAPVNEGAGMYLNDSSNISIGGTDPAERNIFSGNAGSGFSGSQNLSTVRVFGNFIGVGKDGTTPISNGGDAVHIGGADNVRVGGSSIGMSNIFSGNGRSGLSIGSSASGVTSDIIIQGNFFGTDWTGQNAVANQSGLQISGETADLLIGGTSATERNVVSGNNSTGLGFYGQTDGVATGNYIGVAKDGTTPLSNQQVGVMISDASGATIGGTSSEQANVIANSGNVNVLIMGTVPEPGAATARQNRVIGNKIGVDKDGAPQTGISTGVGILGNSDDNIIGGTTPVEANIIYSSTTAISSTDVTFGLVANPEGNSFLGNKIYGGSNNLGIDHCEDSTADFVCDLLIGHTPNDPGDVDAGSNSLLNTPEISAVNQVGDQLTITFNLDVIGSPTDQYRVEFYGNTSADTDGFGRGETLLGTTTASAGSGKTAVLTLGDTADITSSVFSATATVVDDTLSFGYGSTSEFGGLISGAVTSYTAPAAPVPGASNSDSSSAISNALASTGDNLKLLFLIASLLLLGGLGLLAKRHLPRSKK